LLKKIFFFESEQVMKVLGGTIWFSISSSTEQQSVGEKGGRVKSQIYLTTGPCRHDAVFFPLEAPLPQLRKGFWPKAKPPKHVHLTVAFEAFFFGTQPGQDQLLLEIRLY
jgi:hypothetical protein